MVGAVSPRRARHLVIRALGSTNTKGAKKGTLGSTNQGPRGTRGRSTTKEGTLGGAQVGHAWGGAGRVAVHEEQPLEPQPEPRTLALSLTLARTPNPSPNPYPYP